MMHIMLLEIMKLIDRELENIIAGLMNLHRN